MTTALEDPRTGAPALPEADPCGPCGGACCSFALSRVVWLNVNPQDLPLDDGAAARATVKRGAAEGLVREDGTIADMTWRLWRKNETSAYLVFECGHLDGDGRCSVYGDRPRMCRRFACSVLEGRETLGERNARSRWDGGPPRGDTTEVTEAVVEQIANETGAEPPERHDNHE